VGKCTSSGRICLGSSGKWKKKLTQSQMDSRRLLRCGIKSMS
jgi:hypothetical protein